MSKILYIEASNRGEASYSSRGARAFLEAYRVSHPEDEIAHLNLWTTDLPDFDAPAAAGRYKIMRNITHTPQEARAWRRILETIHFFTDADKYVIASPMWNFGIPYRLKQYVDILVQPGHTFAISSKGEYSGLVLDKPAQLILARGGGYRPGVPQDLQRPYLELILGFIGFTEIRTTLIESTGGNLKSAEENLARTCRDLRESAKTF